MARGIQHDELASGNFRDDIIHGLDVPVESNFQMHLRGAGADMIGNGQSAAKTFRRNGAFQRGEQRLGVAVGDGEDGDRSK